MQNVAAAVIIKNNLVLLTRRAPGERLAGFWEFPGGKQKEGETIFECLEREILEELGVEAEAGRVYAQSLYRYEKGVINLIALTADIKNCSFELKVHDRYLWSAPEELLSHNLAPADIPIAEKIAEDYKNHWHLAI